MHFHLAQRDAEPNFSRPPHAQRPHAGDCEVPTANYLGLVGLRVRRKVYTVDAAISAGRVMGIYKRGDVYWYRFMWRGKLVRESAKTGNDKTARKIEAAHRTRLAEGLGDIREKKAAPTLKEFCAGRIEPYAKALSPTKWIWYRAGIRALLKYATLAGMPLDEIRGEHSAGFAGWRTSQEISPGAINSNLRVLRRILRLAADWGVIEIAPKIQLLAGEARACHHAKGGSRVPRNLLAVFARCFLCAH